MNTSPSSRKLTTSHMPVLCRRVSGETMRGPLRPRKRPTATTASTPENPSRSAGMNAANGVSSDTVFSTTGARPICRRIQPIANPMARPTAIPPAPVQRISSQGRRMLEAPETTAATAMR